MDNLDKLWEKVTNPSYFKGVLGSFVKLGLGPKSDSNAYVRFGATGTGHAPNYQIEGDDHSKACFHGPSHKPFNEEEFNNSNISEERFSYKEVQNMLAQVLQEQSR